MPVAQHLEKGIISFDDPPPRIPDKDADDVRVDQAPDSCLPLLEIVVKARVFDRDHRLVGEGLEKRDLSVVERSDLHSPYQDYSNRGAPAQQRRRKCRAMALLFCVRAAHRVVTGLHSEIMDMNRPTIAFGPPDN